MFKFPGIIALRYAEDIFSAQCLNGKRSGMDVAIITILQVSQKLITKFDINLIIVQSHDIG